MLLDVTFLMVLSVLVGIYRALPKSGHGTDLRDQLRIESRVEGCSGIRSGSCTGNW